MTEQSVNGAESGELTYRRVHQAPRQLLFDCLTRPEHLTRYWGPEGTTTPLDRITVDLRPGGVFETVMVNDHDGTEYTMRAVYDEVTPPDRVVWTDLDVGMVTTVTFAELADGSTEVTTHQAKVPAAYRSPEAQRGFATSLDRCDTYVAGLMAEARRGFAAVTDRKEPAMTITATTTGTVRSADGTTIAFERSGTGPPLVLDSAGSSADLTGWSAAVLGALPDGTRRSLAGQWHSVPDDALAPVLTDFFLGR